MKKPITLQEEIKQSRPFGSPEHEAVISLLRTASILKCHLERVAHSEGITIQQFNALRILRGAPTGHTTTEVGDRLIEPNPGSSRLMDRMEKGGLITRSRAGDDRRCVICTITPKGREILDRLDAPILDAGEQFFNQVDESRIVSLNKTLEMIRAAFRSES